MSLQPWDQPTSERARLVARLSADPMTQPQMRASDADRDVVREELNQAFTLGRITHDEHLERLDGVAGSRTMGELFPLVADLVTDRPVSPPSPAPGEATMAVQSPGRKAALVRTGQSWLFVAVITNVIWALTGLGGYYWPIWPMFGMAIPILAALIFSGGGTAETRQQRDERRELRDERRELRDRQRHERRRR